jgi:hypothetical protein
MSWCPSATRRELQPESNAQPAIVPDQFIIHSIAAPWTPGRIYEYWRDSTSLESHFGLGYDGSCAQFIGTQTRADANYHANRRPDGHGAVSMETASNLKHTDPWTPEQVDTIVRVGIWLHEEHGIPLRVCRSWDDPGYGYHRLFPQWSTGGTACPGDARVQQFRDEIFPRIKNGDADDMALSDDDVNRIASKVASTVWGFKLNSPTAPKGDDPARSAGTFLRWGDKHKQDIMDRLDVLEKEIKALGDGGTA